jgi:hypothetical protein
MDIDEIIEMFNDGDLDIPSYFNDTETFLKIMDKRGRLDDLDFETNYMENDYLLYLSETNTEKFREEVAKQIRDVNFEEGKEPVLVLRDASELKTLFCVSRNDIAQKTIGEILSGDSDWDRYWDTTDDVYSDVIEELNEENLKHLYEYIVRILEGVQIEPDTDLLDVISSNQNTDKATITMENIQSVVNNEETMNYLMDENYLPELRGELESIHSNAYNSAYESDIYNGIWDKLDDIFDTSKRKWEYKQHPYKKDTQIQVLELPIRDFYTPIKEYLNNGKGSSQTLEYFGDFIIILEENGDCLSYWAPDYPSWDKIKKDINEIFGDYIG